MLNKQNAQVQAPGRLDVGQEQVTATSDCHLLRNYWVPTAALNSVQMRS
jgi:hypothetical protein